MASIDDVRITIGESDGKPGNLPGLLRAIGAIMVSEVQNNFDTQSFQGESWPARYEGQGDPFVSFAGLIQEFNEGRTRPRQQVAFERKPVLLGSPPVLRNSIGFDVSGSSVEVGADESIAPYAPIHNFGLSSTQPITSDTKKKLSEWLRKLSKARRRQMSKKVGWLFQRDQLTTRVQQRKFIGITKQLERDIADFIERWVETGGRIRPPAKFGA